LGRFIFVHSTLTQVIAGWMHRIRATRSHFFDFCYASVIISEAM
jgi:hypothetical protein